MKNQIIRLCSLFLCLNTIAQVRYIQKKNGKIIEEKAFYKEKDELVAKFKKRLAPEKYFDIIYDFEKPIISNDSIIIKVSNVAYSFFPPQINRKNIFDENAIKGKPFSIKKLETIDQKTITLKDLTGKPTVVNFWHTTCGPCIKEMPILNQIKKKFQNKVNFIAITFETKEKVNKFLKKREFNFTQVINAADFMNSIKFKAFPKTFFIDKNGIVQKIDGVFLPNQKREIIEYINSLL